MSERDRSMFLSVHGSSPNFSQLNSKQIVQSHISQIMPSYKGGKNQMEYVVVFVPQDKNSAKDLENILKNDLSENFGEFLRYRTFKDKKQILEQELKENILYYIIADSRLCKWAQKFSRQEREESNYKKYVGVIKILRKKEYQTAINEINKIKSTKKLQKQQEINYIYHLNLDDNLQDQVQEELIPFIQDKLTYNIEKEKIKAKNWAISNKYKKKGKKKEKLYFYVERDPRGNVYQNIQNISKISAKKGNYKWVQVIPFDSYSDILQHIQKRMEENKNQYSVNEQASQIFTQRLMDKSTSKLIPGTSSRLMGSSRFGAGSSKMGSSRIMSPSKLSASRSKSPGSPSTITSNHYIPSGQMEHDIPKQQTNYIFCSKDFEELQKIYHFVLSQKTDNWKLIQYTDENVGQMKQDLKKLILENRKKEDEMMELDIVSAKTLYLFVPSDDEIAQNKYQNAKNYFRNTEMMLYESPEELRDKLNRFSRNIENYTVVLLKASNTEQHVQVMDFIEKNCEQSEDQIVQLSNLTYKFTSGNNYNSVTSYLSMNSIYNQTNESIYQWLQAILEDRDRYFHPLDGLQGRNVYILVRYDLQDQLLDEKMHQHIANSPRLQKTTYRDENYLKHIITNIRRKKDSVIVLTNDASLREAQSIVKDFDEVGIMNITQRNMKQELKVFAWGPRESIYDLIYQISEKKDKIKRKNYNEVKPSMSFERQKRVLPEKIDFGPGKVITVRVPDNTRYENSIIMENNLDSYFNEQIRFEYYKSPKEIRLINKKEEPISFVICEDNQEDLQYLKKISHEEKDHLRQEYILFTKYPSNHRYLVTDSKHPRFRFISNSWQDIQNYIIGVYQLIAGVDNDSIYDDELIHVFYYSSDEQIAKTLLEKVRDKPIYKNIRLHRLQKGNEFHKLNEVLAMQSPHHLYFFIVNEKNGKETQAQAQEMINQANNTYLPVYQKLPDNIKYNVPKKNVNIISIRNSKLASKGTGVKAVFDSEQQAAEYIADTKLKPYKLNQYKPHVIINNSAQDWYYFLQKYQKLLNRYKFHHIANNKDIYKLVEQIRNVQPEATIWILVNKQEDLRDFQKLIRNIDRGRNIEFIFHGDGWLSKEKIIMVDGVREEIEFFLLNHYKRSNRLFSPEMLQTFNPKVYMSPETSTRIMLKQEQKQKWINDLAAEFITFSGVPEDFKMSNRPIVLIEDINEDTHLKGYNHVRRIIYDSNEKNREKNHNIITRYPNKKDLYVGYYPAEINQYLRFLRFNINHPPIKISRDFPSHLTRIYKEESIHLDEAFENQLLKKNDSIVDIIPFSNLNEAIRDSKKYQSYNSLFIVGRKNAQKLTKQKQEYKYICYDENVRKYALKSNGLLQTEDPDQYAMYLYNLPEKRYEKAKKLKKKVNLMYLNNSSITPLVRDLVPIQQRNPAFELKAYNKINDLRKTENDSVILVDNELHQLHRQQLSGVRNIHYFILDEDRFRNLEPKTDRSEYFITKTEGELPNYLNNARIVSGNQRINQTKPIISIPNVLRKFIPISKPLNIQYLDPNRKFILYPPFQPMQHSPKIKPFETNNFIDSTRVSMFNISLSPDYHNIPHEKIHVPSLSPSPSPSPPPVPDPSPITAAIDYPPNIQLSNYNNVSTNDNLLPIMDPPKPRPTITNLAIIFPESKEFLEIIRVLQENLASQKFKITQFPYKSGYDLDNYFRNDSKKFQSGFDKTLLFFYPIHQRSIEKDLQKRMGTRLQYYIFQDDFDLYYQGFKRFLSPYTMHDYSIPYINREDPQFWLSTNLYNVLVPLNSKKKYDILRCENVRVLIYKPSDLEEIQNQLHRQSQFVIIVCDKKTFHRLKHFPRLSPRCILVIEDSENLKVDEIPLFRYPYKVLYYGPDALNYLKKFRIPSKKIPIKQQTLKTLFFNREIPGQFFQAVSDYYSSYEKVQYYDHVDMFVKLIQRFRNCNNFKMPTNHSIKTPIKLIPKLYIAKNSSYQKDYKNQYSSLENRPEFQKSFKSDIRPSQYAHLPVKEYENPEELANDLERQDCPCLVYVDLNIRQLQRVVRNFKNKHLFIMMYDFRDRWIQSNGDLTAAHLLARPEQLTLKQILFTSMFNEQVFDAFNDMGYFYLSNKADIDKKRNIEFITKENLLDRYNKNPNLLMIVFVESTDKQHIPNCFYNIHEDRSQDQRVKLIFLHHMFIHNEHTLYIKFNEIDPVIYHINKVQMSGRVDYCLYPEGELGNLVWHKFSQNNKGFQSIPYNTLEEIDHIAQDIKGKFRHVEVICDREDHHFIQEKLNEYSIKTKQNSNEFVNYQFIPEIQKKSYALASNIKKSSILNFNENQEDNLEKFETVGHGIDIKLSSGHSKRLEDVIESKNFVLSVNEKLRDLFPIGNFYASKVKYFRDLKALNNTEPGKTQLVISHENYPQIQKMINKNPQIFVVYVSNEMLNGQNSNTIVIKQYQISKLIRQLEGTGTQAIETLSGGQHGSQLNIKNLDEYKIVRIVYDRNIDKQEKRKILNASINNKNIVPMLYKDIETLKQLVKEEQSLVLLMLSEEPKQLTEQMLKEDYTVRGRKKPKMILPKQFDSAIDGLSTILEEHESEIQYMEGNKLTESNINLYLNMIEKNPQKSKKVLRVPPDHFQDEEEEKSNKGLDNDPQNITKLRVHSFIRDTLLDEEEIYQIRQRLDGGVIVVVVEMKHTEDTKQILSKYNILIQQYSHAVNLSQSIRDRKDKVTIVVIEKNMLESIMPIKKQFPRLVFILLNQNQQSIGKEYQPYISGEIHKINQIESIINDIYEENQKIKYSDHMKSPSRFDNRKISTVDVANSERFSVGFNNTRAKKAFVFYKEPENSAIASHMNETINNITFISYREMMDLQKKINIYQGYQSILIANNNDIPGLEDYISKKKEQIYVIRFNPPKDLKQNPKIKLLLSTSSEHDTIQYLENFIKRNSLNSEKTSTFKMGPQRNIPETKKYVQKYQPNTFGTTPRFPQDFVPPKSKESTYSKRYLKSNSRSSKILRTDRSIDPRSIENSGYYH